MLATMRKSKRDNELLRALFGETRLGVMGIFLQWLTLAVLICLLLMSDSLPPRVNIALRLFGVSAFVIGIVLSFRGRSLGPIIVIPAAFGIVILVIVTVLLYPIRWLTHETIDSKPPDQ